MHLSSWWSSESSVFFEDSKWLTCLDSQGPINSTTWLPSVLTDGESSWVTRECGTKQVIFFGFVGKHQCFKPDMNSYREPVDRIQQWYDMGELKEIEHKDQLQGFDGMQGKTSQECSATVQSLDDKRLHKHLSYLRRNRHDHVRVATWMDSDNWLYKTTPRFFALSEGVIQEFSKETKISWCGDSALGNEQPFTVRCCARHARHMCPRGKRNTEP